MEKFLKKGGKGVVGQLFALQLAIQELPKVQVLTWHANVFEEPSGLPPNCPHDHAIQLIPGSQPPNIRPYHYPCLQKDEIENLVDDML